MIGILNQDCANFFIWIENGPILDATKHTSKQCIHQLNLCKQDPKQCLYNLIQDACECVGVPSESL